ncbi:cytochrome b5 domain-containing protein [Cavenderia fasciculata]|uniref:Cytochrome b5 domain-containing protein n=1 Tax=Cavenderia fasciculata TaxID=261658 RepID=F4PRJ1_CACFS|nr:cytochrome b5 domain-containing protein [Cavenderia fasciculata]EGG21331.1 cytochrome b5 domain-containing protein [Cavenderia fasciculata]|eukprot:XP_004359181.1 cytochrome b5 domain-containing protein [Cavenderia fasciculata]
MDRNRIILQPTENEVEEKKSGKRVKQKVPLQPGHSQLDWLKMQRAATPMIHAYEPPRLITIEELEKHNTRQDAWTVYKGKVYNLTPYFTYHPGGDVQLERAAGKDCTFMFDFRHDWVNLEAMLEKLLIGYLAPPQQQ